MAKMLEVVFLVNFCLCSIVIVMASANDNETATLKHELKQLEKTVSDLQMHILAQEQKQTAVLSSVLSKLTDTMDEFDILQHNYTVLEKKYSSLEENETFVDVAGKGFSWQKVSFEANMIRKGDSNQYITFPADSTLIFPTTQYNEGGCWNSYNGVFTASVKGTYMFWIDLTFTDVRVLTISMKKNNKDFGKAFGRLNDLHEVGITSRISITHLVKGDRVKFVANKKVKYMPFVSSCGGVLLH